MPSPTSAVAGRPGLDARRGADDAHDRRQVIAPGGVDAPADLDAAAERRQRDVEALDLGVRRLVNPHTYHVSITAAVFEAQERLLASLT